MRNTVACTAAPLHHHFHYPVRESNVLHASKQLLSRDGHLAARPVARYIDNNSARDVLISGSARNEVGSLQSCYLTVESLSRSFVWFTRAPSPSNVTDALSREVMSSLSLQGVTLKPNSCDKVLDEIFQVIGPEG